jgi:O-antigen/teichoic acid export membrane protein
MDRSIIRGYLERGASHFIDLDFAVKVGSTLATKGLLFLFSLLTSVIVTRALGPAGRGTYAAAITLAALGVQFGNLGLHVSNTYFVAKDSALLHKLIANTLAVSLGLGSAISFTLWAVFTVWPRSAPVNGWALGLAILGIPMGLSYLLLQNLLLGSNKVAAFNYIEILSRFSNIALLVIILSLGLLSPVTGIAANLVAAVISAAGCLAVLGPRSRYFAPSLRVFRITIPYGLRAYWSSVFGFFLLRADLMIVKYMLGPEQTGYYSVAVNLADIILMVPATVALILFPKLAAMNDPVERWTKTKNVLVAVGLIIAAIAVATAVGSSFLIRTLFGSAFLPAATAYRWLMPGIVCISLTSVLASYMSSIKVPLRSIAVYFAMSAANVALNFLWVPKLGIRGASLASTVCYAGSFVGLLWIAMTFKSEEQADPRPQPTGALPEGAAGDVL